MKITIENLRKFVTQYGEVSFMDNTGWTRLSDGTPDGVWELAAKAEQFRVDEGQQLSRAEMEKELDQMEPANVSQISLPDLNTIETDPKRK